MLRATLKGMLARKLRLFLTTAAVVLSVMFVSASFVLTDTLGRSFDGLFSDIYEYTEIEVSKTSDQQTMTGQPVAETMPAADVARVAEVPGVSSAIGTVFADGAYVVDQNNKTVPSLGPPRFGGNWTGESDLVKLRSGRGPTADNEIVLSANLAERTGYEIGDTVPVTFLLSPERREFTLVGIAGYSGGRDTLAGETTVYFTEPVAQEYVLGELDSFNSIDVKVDSGADKAQVRDRVAAALGDGYSVKTGEQLAEESASDIKEGLQFITYVLLGFAGVALFVGCFLILNTFSIIVAQRTRELALFRAMGANRGQVIRSVLTEALVIGLLASVLGLLIGVGLGALLGLGLGSLLSGGTLELAGIGIPPAAVIGSFVVGVGVTLLAALLPAVRASRIAPVAAMRDAATPDRPLTRQTVAGLVVLIIGGAALGAGLRGSLGDATLSGILGGLIVAFIGVALLTPVIARPIVGLLGKALSWSAAGDLGRRNSARNPRRTAITAAALMVSIALVTGISVIFASVQESTVKAVDTGVDAELVIGADPLSGGLGSIPPDVLAEVKQLPDVESAVGVLADLARVDGTDEFMGGLDDPAAAVKTFKLETTAGSLLPLSAGQIIVDDRSAEDRGLQPGSTVTVRFARGDPQQLTVIGIYQRSAIVSGFYLGGEDAATHFSSPTPVQAYVKLRAGADVDAAVDSVERVLADSPDITVSKMEDFIEAQAQIFNTILIFVQLLLGLALVIAVLGIINTLALSMTERTRELGLLRAIGLKRGQVMWMVTVESVVISVFGALLGIAVGVGLGAAVFQALKEEGFTEFALPWPLMVGYVIASVFVGLAAGLLPAIRAARLDVLKAIAYE